jgi:rSAM/selenodomain-associated transferase 2
MKISVVIPVLDEEARIEGCLRRVRSLDGVVEVLVVDGGSIDETVERARRIAGVEVLHAPRGRGVQMNEGARRARGDVLWFLHADVCLPPDAAEWVERALADAGTVAGAFRTWTIDETGRSWIAPLLHLADLRSRYSGLPYGDQAMFIRAEVFRELDGFADLALMEDLELGRRVRRRGEIRIVPACVTVSGRRFLARPVYYFLLVNSMPFLYGCGISPRVLARLYGDVR